MTDTARDMFRAINLTDITHKSDLNNLTVKMNAQFDQLDSRLHHMQKYLNRTGNVVGAFIGFSVGMWLNAMVLLLINS